MISHGYQVKEHDDPIVEVVGAAVDGFSDTSEPGAYLVDMIPFRTSLFLPGALLRILTISSFLLRIVRYVPGWFPGAGWKTKAKRYAGLLEDMADTPHQFVKDQMVSCDRGM